MRGRVGEREGGVVSWIRAEQEGAPQLLAQSLSVSFDGLRSMRQARELRLLLSSAPPKKSHRALFQ